MISIEEALTLKLLNPKKERLFFDISDFVKGDVDSQSVVATRNVAGGVWTPNEARKYLDKPRIDDPNADMLRTDKSSYIEEDKVTYGEDGGRAGETEDES